MKENHSKTSDSMYKQSKVSLLLSKCNWISMQNMYKLNVVTNTIEGFQILVNDNRLQILNQINGDNV